MHDYGSLHNGRCKKEIKLSNMVQFNLHFGIVTKTYNMILLQIPQRTASIATALNTNLSSGIRHPVRARYCLGHAENIKVSLNNSDMILKTLCILNVP